MPYIVDGQSVSVAQEPQNKEGTLWVPLRALSEAVGAQVDWDQDNRVVNLYHRDRIIRVTPGDTTVNVDGEQQELQAAPYLDEGDTWVPVRFFNQPLGYALNVQLDSNTVELTTWNA
jgi:hypothetical protein